MTPGQRLLPVLLAAGLGAGMAWAGPPAQGDRSRTIKGWLVEDVAEQDGGRLVQLSRGSRGLRIQYSAAFWRGNHGRIQSILVEVSDCTNGETLDRNAVPDAKAVRVLITAHLTECAVPPRRIEATLRGFESAFALALAWARDAEAATIAEAEAIAGEGRETDDATADDPDGQVARSRRPNDPLVTACQSIGPSSGCSRNLGGRIDQFGDNRLADGPGGPSSDP